MLYKTCWWYYRLNVGGHFRKVTKRTRFCHQRPKTQILPIVGGQLQKNVNLYPQSFNVKTDWLSFLFVLVYETWQWYHVAGHSVPFPKSDIKCQRTFWAVPAQPLLKAHAVAVPAQLNMCICYTQDWFRTSQTIVQHTGNQALRHFWIRCSPTVLGLQNLVTALLVLLYTAKAR